MKLRILMLYAALAGAVVATHAQSWPHLPPQPPGEEEVIQRRLQVLCPQMTAARAKIEERKEQNDWFDRLVLDRITGAYSVGEGLTVVDQTNAMGSTSVLSQQDNEAWAVTYTVPLSLFRAKNSTDAHADRDHDVLVATQKERVLTETEALRALLLDLQSARSLFESTCKKEGEYTKDRPCIGYFFSAWKSYQTLVSRLDSDGANGCQVPEDLSATARTQAEEMVEATALPATG